MENLTLTAPATPTIGRAINASIAISIARDPSKAARRMFRALVLAGLCTFVCAPSFALGIFFAGAQWHGAALTKIAILTFAFIHYRAAFRLWRWARATVRRRGDPTGNQNTYHGMPVDELVTWLIEKKNFLREDVIRHFAISRKRQFKIAAELEKHGMLVRGESNSRILHPKISREQMVRQLREGFPLAWSEEQQEWCDRTGSAFHFFVDREHKEKQDKERADRLQRKVGRLERKREELVEATASPLAGFFTRPIATV